MIKKKFQPIIYERNKNERVSSGIIDFDLGFNEKGGAMYLLRGIPISRGIAICDILIRYDVTKMIRNYSITDEQIEPEIQKYHKAIGDVKKEIDRLKQNTVNPLNAQNEKILDYYNLLLNEEFFTITIPASIKSNFLPADVVLVNELENIKKQFDKLEGEYFQSRFLDFKGLADRIIRKIYGDIDLASISEPVIIVSEEISPAEVLHIKKDFVLGIATESGSTTSHARDYR